MLCGVEIQIFVQRGVRAATLRQMTVGIFMHVDTGVMRCQHDRSLSDSSRNEGVSGLDVVCVKY